MTLPPDLRSIICAHIPLPILQILNETAPFSTQQVNLIARYLGLTINSESLYNFTPFEYLVRELFFHGEAGYECQFYAETEYALLAAIRANNIELVQYAAERMPIKCFSRDDQLINYCAAVSSREVRAYIAALRGGKLLPVASMDALVSAVKRGDEFEFVLKEIIQYCGKFITREKLNQIIGLKYDYHTADATDLAAFTTILSLLNGEIITDFSQFTAVTRSQYLLRYDLYSIFLVLMIPQIDKFTYLNLGQDMCTYSEVVYDPKESTLKKIPFDIRLAQGYLCGNVSAFILKDDYYNPYEYKMSYVDVKAYLMIYGNKREEPLTVHSYAICELAKQYNIPINGNCEKLRAQQQKINEYYNKLK